MAFDAKPFHGFLIRSTGRRPLDKEGVEVDATLYLTFPAVTDQGDIDYRANWHRLDFKIGFLIREGQQVTLSYRGSRDTQFYPFNQVEAVTAQITAFYGRDTGQAWVGLVPSTFAQPDFIAANVATYTLRLQIRPRLARRQLIPAVIKFHEGDFTDRAGLAGALVVPSPG
jgi:hypothetical protein